MAPKNNEDSDVEISMSELIRHWAIQESLFQTYRTMFLNIQSMLLAACFVIVSVANSKDAILFVVSLAIFAAVSGIILLSVVNHRGKQVYFWQTLILAAEKGIKITRPLDRMKDYQQNETVLIYGDTLIENSAEFIKATSGTHLTRNKMQFWLPIVMAILWIFAMVAFWIKVL